MTGSRGADPDAHPPEPDQERNLASGETAKKISGKMSGDGETSWLYPQI
jgi:hypothetical protein